MCVIKCCMSPEGHDGVGSFAALGSGWQCFLGSPGWAPLHAALTPSMSHHLQCQMYRALRAALCVPQVLLQRL